MRTSSLDIHERIPLLTIHEAPRASPIASKRPSRRLSATPRNSGISFLYAIPDQHSTILEDELDPYMTCCGAPGFSGDHAPVKRVDKNTNRPVTPRLATLMLHGFVEDMTVPAAALQTREQMTNKARMLDANDESLQRYKQSLGLGGGKDLSDPNDKRVCIIKALTMDSPGRAPVTIDLSQPGSEATLKDRPFTIKEGSKFTMSVSFKVQHEVLSGLQYVQVVKRKGIRVSKDSEMLVRLQKETFSCGSRSLTSQQGSYAPNTEKQPLYTKKCKSMDPT